MILELSSKTIRLIKTFIYGIFIATVSVLLTKTAITAIPDDFLFFLTSAAMEYLVSGILAYGLYYYVFKLTSIFKKIGYVLAFGVFLFLLAMGKDYRIHGDIDFEQSFEYFSYLLGLSLLFYSSIYLINRLAYLNRYKKLELELNQAKEHLLRNQLHPHFLFNAFNSLYSLSLKNHPETSDYILKLSSMMRYLTDDTHLIKVPLSKEIAFIEQYIAIEKIRFGTDARIKFNFTNTTEEATLIAPFLLITLVENAFKHGFYTNSKEAFVHINISNTNTELIAIVENSLITKQHFQESTREGKGLKNLKQRLQLLYPKSATIETVTNAKIYTTVLKIIMD